MAHLIVFTGVDGVGKSTLVDRLENERVLPGATFVRKDTSLNVDLVRTFHAREFDDARDWTFGRFAEAAAIATCLDFLDHYSRNIEPKLSGDGVVICDRYALCYQAYLMSTGSRFDAAALLAKVTPPDLVIHVEVPISVAGARLRARPHRTEDEDEVVITRFAEAYSRLLPSVKKKAILNNDRPLEETWRALNAALRTYGATALSDNGVTPRCWT